VQAPAPRWPRSDLGRLPAGHQLDHLGGGLRGGEAGAEAVVAEEAGGGREELEAGLGVRLGNEQEEDRLDRLPAATPATTLPGLPVDHAGARHPERDAGLGEPDDTDVRQSDPVRGSREGYRSSPAVGRGLTSLVR
jgi:hypothetical protein